MSPINKIITEVLEKGPQHIINTVKPVVDTISKSLQTQETPNSSNQQWSDDEYLVKLEARVSQLEAKLAELESKLTTKLN